jgi:hypothetical protein
MIVQFKTLDNAMWAADVAGLKWAQIDRPASEPECLVLQRGELVAQGYGVYVMKGRTSKSPAPGEGLCNFGVMPVVSGTTLDIHLAANVPVTDFTMPVPVTQINYKIIERPGQKVTELRYDKPKHVAASPQIPVEVSQPQVSHPAATDPSVIDEPMSNTTEIGGGMVAAEITRENLPR